MSLIDIFRGGATRTKDPFQDDVALAAIIQREADRPSRGVPRPDLSDEEAANTLLWAARSIS